MEDILFISTTRSLMIQDLKKLVTKISAYIVLYWVTRYCLVNIRPHLILKECLAESRSFLFRSVALTSRFCFVHLFLCTFASRGLIVLSESLLKLETCVQRAYFDSLPDLPLVGFWIEIQCLKDFSIASELVLGSIYCELGPDPLTFLARKRKIHALH